MKKVGVVGLGTIGTATARYIQRNSSYYVIGQDIDEDRVRQLRKENLLHATTDFSEINGCNVIIIAVGTHWKGGEPDVSNIFEVARKVDKTYDGLISIESTVLPSTCWKLRLNYGLSEANIVHVPHRYWGEKPEKYGVRQKRVFGALDKRSEEVGRAFYESLDIPLTKTYSTRTAAMSKIVENANRFVKIAFVEELRRVCQEQGLNYENIREAANTKWNVDLLEARNGIGGHCLPKDIRFFASLGSTPLSNGAISTDTRYKKGVGEDKKNEQFRREGEANDR